MALVLRDIGCPSAQSVWSVAPFLAFMQLLPRGKNDAHSIWWEYVDRALKTPRSCSYLCIPSVRFHTKQTNKQTNKNKQTDKQTNKQTNKPFKRTQFVSA